MRKDPPREFSENDITFLIETIDPRLTARKEELRRSRDFVEKILDQHNERLLERITSMEEEEMLVRISPRLLFEILLRNTARVLHREGYVLEKVGHQIIPVFEAKKGSQFLSKKPVLFYLADMLSSLGDDNDMAGTVACPTKDYFSVRSIREIRRHSCNSSPHKKTFDIFQNII